MNKSQKEMIDELKRSCRLDGYQVDQLYGKTMSELRELYENLLGDADL